MAFRPQVVISEERHHSLAVSGQSISVSNGRRISLFNFKIQADVFNAFFRGISYRHLFAIVRVKITNCCIISRAFPD